MSGNWRLAGNFLLSDSVGPFRFFACANLPTHPSTGLALRLSLLQEPGEAIVSLILSGCWPCNVHRISFARHFEEFNQVAFIVAAL